MSEKAKQPIPGVGIEPRREGEDTYCAAPVERVILDESMNIIPMISNGRHSVSDLNRTLPNQTFQTPYPPITPAQSTAQTAKSLPNPSQPITPFQSIAPSAKPLSNPFSTVTPTLTTASPATQFPSLSDPYSTNPFSPSCTPVTSVSTTRPNCASVCPPYVPTPPTSVPTATTTWTQQPFLANYSQYSQFSSCVAYNLPPHPHVLAYKTVNPVPPIPNNPGLLPLSGQVPTGVKATVATQTTPHIPSPVPSPVPLSHDLINPLKFEDTVSPLAQERVELFLKQVEAVTQNDSLRTVVALNKVDEIMRDTLITALDEWPKFKACMRTHFGQDTPFETAWNEVKSYVYNIEGCPQTFLAKIVSKYDAIASKYSVDIPERETFLKGRIYKYLPNELQHELEDFTDPGVPARAFVGMLMTSRSRYLAGLRRQHTHSGLVLTHLGPYVPPSSDSIGRDVCDLAEGVQWLSVERSVNKTSESQRGLLKPRNHCEQENHASQECPSQPRQRACFDCLRMNCYRGHPRCPGKKIRPAWRKGD